MAERDQFHESGAGPFIAFPRTRHLLAGAGAGLGSTLWLNAAGPLAGIVAIGGALTLLHTLAAALIVVLAMLVATAGTLVAADWRADVRSRQAWAQIAPATAELSLPLSTVTPWGIDPRYLPVVENEAMRRVFRAHRFALSAAALQTVPELPDAMRATRLIIRDTGPEITSRNKTSGTVVSDVGISARALRNLASAISAEAPIAVASRRGSAAAVQVGRAAPRARLVANANGRSGWPTRIEPFHERTLPGGRTADVIILGSSRDDQSQSFPDDSTRCNFAGSTEPPSCRGPPEVAGHRARTTETTPAKLSVKGARQEPAAGALPTADPIVRDNLGHQVPVCAAELDVIETYLDQMFRDLLASSTGGSEQERA